MHSTIVMFYNGVTLIVTMKLLCHHLVSVFFLLVLYTYSIFVVATIIKMMPFDIPRTRRRMDEPFRVDRPMSVAQFERDILPLLTSSDIANLNEGIPTLFETFTTTLRNQSALEAETLTLPMIMTQREGRFLDSKLRPRFFTTKLPECCVNTASKLQDALIRETLVMQKDPELWLGNVSEIRAYVRRSKLLSLRAHSMNLVSFRTFLNEMDALHSRVQHDVSFLVVTPNQLMAYPTMLPLFRNFGLQLIEPHYMLTAYLARREKPVYYFRRRKVYKYATAGNYMRTPLVERLFYTILNDQSKLSHGYVMSGLGYAFNHSHERGYKLVQNVLSNHHRPNFVIYIHIPDYLLYEIPRYLAFDPSTNYTVLMFNDELLKTTDTIGQKYFEGRILPEDDVPKFVPFCFTTEFGHVEFCSLLEWKTVKPKTVVVFQPNMTIELSEDKTEFDEQAGFTPDQVILFDFNEYNFPFDAGNYLYDRLYVCFFTRTYPAREFSVFRQVITLEDISEWTNIEPTIPYYQCTYDKEVSDKNMNYPRGKSTVSEWLLNVTRTNNPDKFPGAYHDIHGEYFMQHMASPIPSLGQISERATFYRDVDDYSDKLDLKDVEGRVEYFQNVKKLPLWMRDSPITIEWGRICPVTTLDEAMVFRGHYSFPLKWGTTTYMLRSKEAIYKFLYNPMYRKLQWAWLTNSHVLVSGQPFCGSRYVATAIALILKAPHIYYDKIYKTALKIKRIHTHCYYLESCWKAIWYHEFDLYTKFEARRFKSFLPWAMRRTKIARALVIKGMDEPIINRELRFQCYYPFYKLSSAQPSNVFPRLEFEFPELEEIACNWEYGILEGYVRVLDLIVLYVLQVECPPMFLARIIYQTPKRLLPEFFEIQHPREVFVSANILYEYYYRALEMPTALEESRILNQAIFQAMAKRGTTAGQGWVASGIKVHPNFMQTMSEAGMPHRIVYVTDPSFSVFHRVYAGDTLLQTVELATDFSLFSLYLCPVEFKTCYKEMLDNKHKKIKTQKSIFGQKRCRLLYNRKCCFRCTIGSLKCSCHELPTMFTVIKACKNMKPPSAMTSKGLADSDHSPIWEMLKNTATYPGGNKTCSSDHKNLNYHDHPTFKVIPMRRPQWKYVYCRRYAFDYFYKLSSQQLYPHLNLEVRRIRPNKFSEMATEIALDIMVLPENCCCRFLCLCNPISLQEYARFP